MRVNLAAEQSLTCSSPSWYSPRAVPLPVAQGSKVLPGLESSIMAWFNAAHGSRLLLPLSQASSTLPPRRWGTVGAVTSSVCCGCSTLVCCALHRPFSSSAHVLCAWHTMAGGLLLEKNGSSGWKDHLVLLHYFSHAVNPLSDPCLEPGESDLEFSFSFSLGAITATLSSCTTAICAGQRQ